MNNTVYRPPSVLPLKMEVADLNLHGLAALKGTTQTRKLPFSPAQALFIDIDDTIIRCTGNKDNHDQWLLRQRLLSRMCDYAIRQRGIERTRAEQIIRQVWDSIRWWHSTDFLLALGLDSAQIAAFWQYAYEQERPDFKPVSPHLTKIIPALHRAGYRMFITSNNPSSSILLKLRLAGLGQIWGSPYFLQYFGPPDLHAMKAEPRFWEQCLARTGLDGKHVVSIGDLWKDDVLAAQAAGIANCILLWPEQHVPHADRPGVWRADSWSQIASLLLPPEEADRVTSEMHEQISLSVGEVVGPRDQAGIGHMSDNGEIRQEDFTRT